MTVKRTIVLTIFIIPLSLMVVFSPFLPWEVYMTIEHIYKTFTLVPSGLGDAPWFFYDFPLVMVISYLPLIGGFLALIGFLVYLLEFKIGRTLLVIGGVLGIITYVLYIVIWLLPLIIGNIFGQAMLAIFGIGFSISFESKSLVPNLYGAYFCLIPAIGLIFTRFFMKMTEYDESLEEFKGFKDEDMETPYEKKVAGAGTIFCPKCGAKTPVKSLFCEQCGTYL